MDSDKNPTAIFTGKIANVSAVKFDKDGEYDVTVSGELTLHGITKPVETGATIKVSGKSIKAITSFNIKLQDYGVNGGAIAAGKVSKEPSITVIAEF